LAHAAYFLRDYSKAGTLRAGARTFDQRVRASIFIWLVMCWIDLVFSQAIWLTSAVNRAISAEMSDSSSALAGLAGSLAIDLARL
jgi:hypothetical protein